MASSDRPRRRSNILAWFLIGFGLYMLGQRLGWFRFDLLNVVWQFWPVLLVILGLSLIIGRRHSGLALAVGGLLTLALFAGVAIVAPDEFGTTESPVQTWSYPSQGVRSGRVTLHTNGADVQLGALPAEDGQFAAGTFMTDRVRLKEQFRVDDGVADLVLGSDQHGWWFGSKRSHHWEIELTPDVPLDLSLSASAVSLDADLRALRLTQLNLESNAGDVTLRLPAGAYAGTISVNAASLVIELPNDVAAQFTINANVSSIDSGSRFTQQGKLYRTANWDTAARRIDLTIDANATSIELR